MKYLTDYMSLPKHTALVIAAWVMAAWHCEKVWDKFPNLGIVSPEMRCGKSKLLELLSFICPNAVQTDNLTAAVLFRVVDKQKPTLLFDEAQRLMSGGPMSESKQELLTLLNGSISRRSAKVLRCVKEGQDFIPKSFATFCPKVFALIGRLDSVLADRSLPVNMQRKTKEDKKRRLIGREPEMRGDSLRALLEEWQKESEVVVTALYAIIEPYDIENERMAELLMPLQAVLMAVGSEEGPPILKSYAYSLDEKDKHQDKQTNNIRLLAACREIFGDEEFMCTTTELIPALIAREEEPWHRWNKGYGINPESLSNLLKQFDIGPKPDRRGKVRGYYRAHFEEAWKRYLPESPSNPSILSKTQ